LGYATGLNCSLGFCEIAAVALRRRPETVADRIDQLMAAVSIADERERLQRLAEHLAPDAYTRFRHDGWLRITLRRSSEVDMHHTHFRYAWESLEGSRAAMKGWCFGWVDAEGKISRIVSFNDPVRDRVS
jgi:hypothetical protein